MAKLRVGDIEIDGDRISIGGHQMTGTPGTPGKPTVEAGRSIVVSTPSQPALRTAVPVAGPSLDGLSALAKLPVKATWLIGGGAIGMAAGSIILMLASAPLDLVGVAFHGGLLLTAGLGAAGLGGLKQFAAARSRAQKTARDQAELGPVVEKLRGLLREPDKAQTVEWITQALGAGEAKTVRALAHMRETGELREDLNLDSGQYFYYVEAAEPPKLRGLDDRLAELERSNGK